MKKTILKSVILSGLCMLLLPACEQPEYLNPSAASEAQVTKDVNGLLALANGNQQRFSVGRQSPVYTSIVGSGITVRELRVLNVGNIDEDNLDKGGATVDGANGIVRNLWSQCNIVRVHADLILDNLSVVPDPGVKAGLQAHASFFKALAIGTMAQFFEQVTIEAALKPKFVSRTDALNAAITLLESAGAALAANPPPAAYTSKIVGGINLTHSINALIARYSLMVGNYDKAISAANAASLTVTSGFNYELVNPNPIFNVAFFGVNVVQPTDLNLGLPVGLRPVTADRRLDFLFVTRTPPTSGSTAGIFFGKAFFKSNTDAIPVYLPGEMRLIKAEAEARKNNLPAAITELNAVLTKTTDAWGVGAGLPAYAGASTQTDILNEIYRNRRIELAFSGLGLEDARRFGRPVAVTAGSERNRNFYPYPFLERDNNTNTPADPAQ